MDEANANTLLTNARETLLASRSNVPLLLTKSAAGMVCSWYMRDAADALSDETGWTRLEEIADFLREHCWEGGRSGVCWQTVIVSHKRWPITPSCYMALINFVACRWREADATLRSQQPMRPWRCFTMSRTAVSISLPLDQTDLIFAQTESSTKVAAGNATLTRLPQLARNVGTATTSGRRNQYPEMGLSGYGALSCQSLQLH